MTSPGLSPRTRFMMKVSVPLAPEGCWLWTAATTSNGYGMFGYETGRSTTAHRWSYMHFVGPIPEGHQVDHLCRVPLCVNPDHLEAVTRHENIRRALPFRPRGDREARRAERAAARAAELALLPVTDVELPDFPSAGAA